MLSWTGGRAPVRIRGHKAASSPMPGTCQCDHFLSFCHYFAAHSAWVWAARQGQQRAKKRTPPGRGTCENQGSETLNHWAPEAQGGGLVWKDLSCKVPLSHPSLTPGRGFLWILQPCPGSGPQFADLTQAGQGERRPVFTPRGPPFLFLQLISTGLLGLCCPLP